MVQIILIRPGSTDYDLQGRIQGTLDVPLNEQGVREVEREIEELKQKNIQAIYCCDCEAATQTGQRIAAAIELKWKKLDNMRNLDHGLWQGMLISEVKRKQPKVYRQWQEQPDSVRPPEGETLAEARQRVDAAFTKLLKRHNEGVIGLVVPEPLASLVACYLGKPELGNLWQAGLDHGRWELIEVSSPSLAHSG